MNIKVTVLYCNRVTVAQVSPTIKLIDIIKYCIEGGFAKEQMLKDPGIYIPNKNLLCNGQGLQDALERYFPIIDLQGPPTEIIILRQEEFIQYEDSFKSQPSLGQDSEPPDVMESQQLKSQPKVDDLLPDLSSSNLQASLQLKSQPNVDDLMPLSSSNLQQTVQQQQSQQSGQDFVLYFETKDGLQQQKFYLSTKTSKITGNTTPDQLRDILFAHLGFNDRSIVDLNLYFNTIPLQGPKGAKTFDQLSISNGSNIEIKARWTGGNQL